MDLRQSRYHAKQAREHYKAAREALTIRRTAQRARESEFLLGSAYSALTAAGKLMRARSPSLISSGASLSPLPRDNASEEGRDVIIADDDSLEIEAKAAWANARSNVQQLQLQYDDIDDSYRRLLVDHLVAYPNGTKASFDRVWLRRGGQSYEDMREGALCFLREEQDRYRDIRREAHAFGIKDLPLSPPYFADQEKDQHTDSAGTASKARRRASASFNERRVRKWSRAVARGISPRRPSATPELSLESIHSCGNPGDGSDSESKSTLIKRHRRSRDARHKSIQEAKQHQRDTKQKLWQGRLRHTKAKHGRSMRLSAGELEHPWAKTHPTLSS